MERWLGALASNFINLMRVAYVLVGMTAILVVRGQVSSRIDDLTDTIATSIADDVMKGKQTRGEVTDSMTKSAADKVTPQILELGKLMGSPSDASKAILNKVKQKLQKEGDGLSPSPSISSMYD